MDNLTSTGVDDTDGMQSSSSGKERAACPVCGQTVSTDAVTLNAHLDDCLATSDARGGSWPSADQPAPASSGKRAHDDDGASGMTPGKRGTSNKTPLTLSNLPAAEDPHGTPKRNTAATKKTAARRTGLNSEPGVSPSSSRGSANVNSQSRLITDWTTHSGQGSRARLKSELIELSSTSQSEDTDESSSTVTAPIGPSEEFGTDGHIGPNGQLEMPKECTTRKCQPVLDQFRPLAEQMRPTTLSDYEGQDKVLGDGTMLRSLIEAHDIPSMILWGPPGCGKTTLAHIIAQESKRRQKSRFVSLSATTAGVKDVKEVVERAKNEQVMFKRKTILFIDEVHRFNKSQQDAFLPHVENGTITLIGATTENPSFVLNNALLSRCRVVIMDQLPVSSIEVILGRTLQKLNVQTVEDVEDLSSSSSSLYVVKDAIKLLAESCEGDARKALNGLQMAIQASSQGGNTFAKVITKEHIVEGLQKTHTLYDRTGDQHYDTISAYIKSMRGSDQNASLYWLARMLEGGEDPRFIARRLIIFASEDIGMADSNALTLATSTFQACQFIGMPESKMMLSHCTVYMARAPKSRACCDAYAEAEKMVRSHEGPLPPVPLHLRNAPTRLMKEMGCAKNYRMYNYDGKALPFLPESLKHCNFFKK